MRGDDPGDDRNEAGGSHKDNKAAETQQTDDEEQNRLVKADGGEESKGSKKMPTVDWTDDIRPALIDQFIYCKLVFIVFCFLFWVFTITVTFMLTNYAGRNDDPKGLRTFVELTPDEAKEFVMTWYLAIFIWGEVINELRIVVISLMAPIRALELFNAWHAIYAQDGGDKPYSSNAKSFKDFHTGFCSGCSCVTTLLIPTESVETALDALFTIDIFQCKDKRYDEDRLEYTTNYFEIDFDDKNEAAGDNTGGADSKANGNATDRENLIGANASNTLNMNENSAVPISKKTTGKKKTGGKKSAKGTGKGSKNKKAN